MSIPLSNSAVTSFYSKEEREELIRINQQKLEEIKKAQNSDNQQDAIKAMEKSDRQLHELYKRVKKRYIEAFKGDMDAILADASAILQAVRKKHFQDEIETIRNLTPKEEEIIEFYNDQPEPQRSEKIQRAKDMIKAKRKAAAANYENCYNYLLLHLDAQIEALQYYGLPLSGLEELTAAKASEWYKKPKSKQKESTAHIETAVEKAKRLFYTMPNSPASNFLIDILSAGDSIADLPARKKQVNYGAKYEVKSSGNKRLVSMENYKGTAKVTVELADIEKVTGSNKPAKKLLVLSLIKANEQAIHNGQLTKEYISFPLQELLDIGFYKTPQSARKGFSSGADILTSIKVKGKVKKSKKQGAEIDALEVLFTGARIERGQCLIFFNPRISWGFLTQYFTILPSYYFRLPNRASDLLYYIFYLARQRVKEIEDRGYFTISMRAVQERLNLPSEVGNKDPHRTIKEPVEEAITAIEEASKDIEFTITPYYDIEAPISEYLDNGYLKIELKGKYAKDFIELSKDTTKQIQTAERRREAIIQKAIATNLAKQLESGETSE